ncbi:hypothetical protein N7462_001345 [Penicillium macrosclerotiorum]|uniref:uncharacterized protein n=1 Tax=Penicillium macrosclerotiorum TaxID=303699 RepID=UPI0025469C99|nr:uncharacterized protein N7462_001345 [Penicillium macrosclerotiorum]KAJ5691922.1 hypothetical protein N7462_001345 [Penicillium macrosclerotiorum]
MNQSRRLLTSTHPVTLEGPEIIVNRRDSVDDMTSPAAVLSKPGVEAAIENKALSASAVAPISPVMLLGPAVFDTSENSTESSSSPISPPCETPKDPAMLALPATDDRVVSQPEASLDANQREDKTLKDSAEALSLELVPTVDADYTESPDSDGKDKWPWHLPRFQEEIALPDMNRRHSVVTERETDLKDAIRLIADSVAQQRQMAARAVLFHPAIWMLFAIIAVVIFYSDRIEQLDRLQPYLNTMDNTTCFLISIGVLMTFAHAVQWRLHGYIDAAEAKTINWLFSLDDGDTVVSVSSGRGQQVEKRYIGVGKRDIVLVIRNEATTGESGLIGTLVIRVEPINESDRAEDKTGKERDKAAVLPLVAPEKCRAIIRAWTIQQDRRSRGLGSCLVEDTVALCASYGWHGPEFAPDHANALRILPRMFNQSMDRTEEYARKTLEVYRQKYTPDGLQE